MHPELLTRIALDQHRQPAIGRPSAPKGSAPRRRALPYRLSWSRTTLAAAAGRRRSRSVVIVISATRLL